MVVIVIMSYECRTCNHCECGMKYILRNPFFEAAGCFGTLQPGSLGDSYIVYKLLIERKYVLFGKLIWQCKTSFSKGNLLKNRARKTKNNNL